MGYSKLVAKTAHLLKKRLAHSVVATPSLCLRLEGLANRFQKMFFFAEACNTQQSNANTIFFLRQIFTYWGDSRVDAKLCQSKTASSAFAPS